jgi:hypothetical protein
MPWSKIVLLEDCVCSLWCDDRSVSLVSAKANLKEQCEPLWSSEGGVVVNRRQSRTMWRTLKYYVDDVLAYVLPFLTSQAPPW